MPPGIRGALGQVKHAYRTAAIIRDFAITRDELTKALTLTGTVAHADTFLLTQSPLVFVLATKHGATRWPVESWRIVDARCYATLTMPT